MSALESNRFLVALESLIERCRILAGGSLGQSTTLETDPTIGLIAERFARLVETLGLLELDEEFLTVLLAAELSPEIQRLVAAEHLAGAEPWLTLGLAARLLGGDASIVAQLGQRIDGEGPFRHGALVEEAASRRRKRPPLAGRRVKLAADLADWLVRGVRFGEGTAELDAPVFIDEEEHSRVRERLAAAVERGQPIIVEITGPEGTGRRALAHELAGAADGAGGAGLVMASLNPDLESHDVTWSLRALLRNARLDGAVPCLVVTGRAAGMETSGQESESEMSRTRAPRYDVDAELARAIGEASATLFVVAEEPLRALDRCGLAVARVRTHFPSPGERAQILEEETARAGAMADGAIDWWQLARRYALDGPRLCAAVRVAMDECALRTGGAEPLRLSFEDLQRGCRRQVKNEMERLATRVTASHVAGDMVVDSDVLAGMEEMIAYVRHGRQVYEGWGFAHRHSLAQGVTALFTGPPGTGKSMCATVMARQLDMELFRVDLSRIVSKWIGETEKNLGKVFDDAERSHAIILFDEADSLFARRTDVKSSVDRYANLEVNYLLQRMESFSGVTILTSNSKDTIDDAFKRRINFKLHFQKPDDEARAMLWEKVFPPGAPLAKDFDPQRLAKAFDLTGATIRNAAVRAAFLAADSEDGNREITQARCLEAAEREAREMGMLTRSAREKQLPEAPPEPSPAQPSGSGNGRSATRMVPITHPRRR